MLVKRTGQDDPALQAIAQVVHDIDLKDAKFSRPEAAGIGQLISGISMAHLEDEQRLERGMAVFDDFLAYFRGEAASNV